MPTLHKRIAHRELRNNSSAVLRAVQSGDTYEITNNGVVVAMLVPPQTSNRLPEPAKPATVKGGWNRIERVTSPYTTADVLDYLRGDK